MGITSHNIPLHPYVSLGAHCSNLMGTPTGIVPPGHQAPKHLGCFQLFSSGINCSLFPNA